MKVRLTKVLALSLMLFAATGTQAQSTTDVDGITSATQQTASRQPRSHRPRMTVDSLNTYMTANLNLTSTQLEKVKALNAEYSDIIEDPNHRVDIMAAVRAMGVRQVLLPSATPTKRHRRPTPPRAGIRLP